MTEFNPSSRLTRSIAAAAATLCSVLVLASVVGIALHYDQGATTQWAATVTTQRA